MPVSPDKADKGDLYAEFAALLEKHRRLQCEFDWRNCALDSASTYFMILDVVRTPWTIIYANRAVAQDHGYEPADLLGQSPAILTPLAYNRAAYRHLGKAVRDGRSANAELVARRKDNSIFRIGMGLTRLCQSTQGAIRYLAIGADITGRLEQERTQTLLQEQLVNAMRERERMGIGLRLAQKLESVGRLAVGIAHEIHTPMQYIGASVSFLQTAQADLMRVLKTYRSAFQQLRESKSSQELLERVRVAEQGLDSTCLGKEIPRAFERTLVGVERVAAIVRAMKEFAQPNTFEQNPADLNQAIQTTLVVASHEYKYCAQIETRFGELPAVMCNVGELNHVFLNLIVNAAHAIAESGKPMDEGQISITTAVSGDSVEIGVADNGCGIPPESVDKIFDPCFTTKPPGGGTGQGLAITRAIVTERHGGSIDVHSTVGSGTRFVLRLPIAGRPAAPAT